jgi:CRISPR-associated protein Csb2
VSRGSAELPTCLHGPTPDHGHARYLPEDADRDGIIDHVTVFASGGLDGVAKRLLAMSDRLFVPGAGAHDLEAVWMGHAGDTALFGRSRTWISRIPYVAPWFKDGFEDQVRKELNPTSTNERSHWWVPTNLAEGVKVEPRGGKPSAEWVLVRPEKPPPCPPRAAMLELTFAEPVSGPIVLGYASHFGLGQFVPAQAPGA